MVRRDPQTGQFVSDSEADDWGDFTRMTGKVAYHIPAADLSGGTPSDVIEGDETVLIDMGDKLENDEVYHIDAFKVSAWLGAPTTSTAESAVYLDYEIGGDAELTNAGLKSSGFWSNSTDKSSGKVDIMYHDDEAGPQWFTGSLYGEASLNDTTNGTGAGGDAENESHFISFREELGAGPVYDRDDAVYAPAELHADNISDHSIASLITVMTYGRVETLD